jgi:hypothetical protein
MEDFKTRKLNTHRQSVTNKEKIEHKQEITNSEKKNKKILKNKEGGFTPGTRVRDMKEIIERRYTQDLLLQAPPIRAEEHKTVELPRKLTYEECKSHRKSEEHPPGFKRGSMRIFYMAKALEDRLHQKREDTNDINKEDQIVQIMMDKPLVNQSKKPSRVKLSL